MAVITKKVIVGKFCGLIPKGGLVVSLAAARLFTQVMLHFRKEACRLNLY